LMNRLFQTAPVRLETWTFIVLTGFAAFLAVELEKWIRSKTAASAHASEQAP
jgi:hypothetical protein